MTRAYPRAPAPGVMMVAVLALVTVEASPLRAQPPVPRAPKSSAAPPGAHHGTPKGWKFNWPKGDAAKGREVFQKLECYSCHEVRGEKFPAPTDRNKVGPELSVMAPLHDADYFAEAILNPSAVIQKGQGYHGPDGSSKMPSFNDSMTVQELIDLVTFVKGLKPPGKAPAGAATGAPAGGGHGGH